jgi:hypothetical protein
MTTDGIPRGFNEAYAEDFGLPGSDVTHWGILRRNEAGKMRACDYSSENGTCPRQWPLSELSPATISERWGDGEYRLQWFGADPENPDPSKRFVGKGLGKFFRLKTPEPTAVRAPAPQQPAASALAGSPLAGFAQTFELMALFDQRANMQLQNVMQIAAGLAGRGSGIDGVQLTQILADQRAQTEAMIERITTANNAQVEALRAEVASLRSELDGGEDEDEEESPAVEVVKRAAPLFRTGKPIGDTLKTAAMNFVVENPDKVFDLLKPIVPLVAAAVAAGAQPQPQPQPQASVAPPRPRAVPASIPEPTPAPPSAPAPTGLNALLAADAKPEGLQAAS